MTTENQFGNNVSSITSYPLSRNTELHRSPASSDVWKNKSSDSTTTNSNIRSIDEHNNPSLLSLFISSHESSEMSDEEPSNNQFANTTVHPSPASSHIRTNTTSKRVNFNDSSTIARTHPLQYFYKTNLPNLSDIRPISEPNIIPTNLTGDQTKKSKSSDNYNTSARMFKNYFRATSFSHPNIQLLDNALMRANKLRRISFPRSNKVIIEAPTTIPTSQENVETEKERKNFLVVIDKKKIRQFLSSTTTSRTPVDGSPPLSSAHSSRRSVNQYEGQKWGLCRPGVAIVVVAVLTLLLRVNPCIMCAILLLNPSGSKSGKTFHWIVIYGPAALLIQAIILTCVSILLLATICKGNPKLMIPFMVTESTATIFWFLTTIYFLISLPKDNSITGIAIITGCGVLYDLIATLVVLAAYLDLYRIRRTNIKIKAHVSYFIFVHWLINLLHRGRNNV